MRKNLLGIYEKAINTRFTWEERILMAKRAGFDFIEMSIDETDERLARLDWNRREILDLLQHLQHHNFYINSICLSAHRRFPLGSKDPIIRARALEIALKACVLAKRLGVRIIQVAAYDVYYEPSDEETLRNFINGIRKFAQFAQRYSVTLAFETMDTKLAGTITRCINLINQAGLRNFFIYPDLGNLNRFTDDVEAEIEAGRQYALAYHFKDTLPDVFKRVPFGAGDVDFVHSLQAVIRTRFTGPFLIEMWSDEDPGEKFAHNLARLVEAREFFEDKMRNAQQACKEHNR